MWNNLDDAGFERKPSFDLFDLSGFSAKVETASVSDELIIEAIKSTPDYLKQTIEEECETDEAIEKGDAETHANCFVMNAILWLCQQMHKDTGQTDFMGVLNAYDMPPRYANMINQLRLIDDERKSADKVATVAELNDIWNIE